MSNSDGNDCRLSSGACGQFSLLFYEFHWLYIRTNARKKMTANPMSCSKKKKKSDDNKGIIAVRSIEDQKHNGPGEKIPSDSLARVIVFSAMMQQRGDGQLSTSPPSLAIRHVRVTTPFVSVREQTICASVLILINSEMCNNVRHGAQSVDEVMILSTNLVSSNKYEGLR